MNNRFGVFSLSAILFFSYTFFAPLTARAEFPDKPIRLIVAVGPGGAIDRVSRGLASFWHETLGQPVVVENRKGGGGIVAWRRIMKAKPDGYTIISHHAPMVNTMLIRHKPNFGLKDMAFINVQWIDPNIVLTHKDTGWKNLSDMIAAVKKSPNKYSLATTSPITTATLILHALNLKMKIVPYPSGGASRAAILGQHTTTAASGSESALGLGPSIIGLGISMKNKAWPGVKTVNEQLKEYNATVPILASHRFFAVPAAVKKKYPKRFAKLVSSYKELLTKNKGFRKFLKRNKMGNLWTGPEEATKIAQRMHAVTSEIYSRIKNKKRKK